MKTSNHTQLSRHACLVLMIVMTVLTCFSNSYDFIVDGLAYKKHADGQTVGVTSLDIFNNYPNLLEANIPEAVTYNGMTYTVTAIESLAFSGWVSHNPIPLTKVVIPNTVTRISDDAFLKCQNLKTVTFGDNVESIGSSAFYQCSSLESIELPIKLTKIEGNTFWGCSSLKSVTIGKNIESIGVNAFYSCHNLLDIYTHLMNPIATTIIHDPFYGVRQSLCSLHVPLGTKEFYESCEYWNSFANIVEDLVADYDSHGWIHLNVSNVSTFPGRTHQLTAFSNPYDMDLSWSSSDESVATVDENGIVKSVATGDAVITVIGNASNNPTATCQVTVKNTGNMNDDANGDGLVDISDVNQVINMMLGKGGISSDATQEGTCSCDVTGDGRVDISDVNQVINTMLGKPKSILRCLVNDVVLTMIHVDAGTFMMGATPEQGIYLPEDNEKPAHQVTLSSYYIGQTEVTKELWVAVMGGTPPNYSNPDHPNNDKVPISSVDWDLCQTFIAELNELTGLNFRLPTEAEWEFAARGGNKSQGYIYSGSNNINDVAWYSKPNPMDNPFVAPQPVAFKKANELDLYDMSGNVREWCQDWYGSYSSDEQINPAGPSFGEYRVTRGGSVYDFSNRCRVSSRMASSSINAQDFGLRLAM
ncbi:MAG: SUMF1/EgtB/PvdO family nonheme iron enzyme [Muribaculaceae bacterium]|nr:SUMF1/EgtB/PvdO family nonheme iron enzyme [Muribaculaceae bacterium]